MRLRYSNNVEFPPVDNTRLFMYNSFQKKKSIIKMKERQLTCRMESPSDNKSKKHCWIARRWCCRTVQIRCWYNRVVIKRKNLLKISHVNDTIQNKTKRSNNKKPLTTNVKISRIGYGKLNTIWLAAVFTNCNKPNACCMTNSCRSCFSSGKLKVGKFRIYLIF